MDRLGHSDRSSVGSVIIVILLLASTFSIASHSSTGLIAVPIVAAEDASTTNSTALTTTTSLESTNSSTAESSISTSDNSTQSTVVSISTSMLSNSTISNLTSTSNSWTISDSTSVNATSTASTQASTTTFSASTNSSTTRAIASNTTTTVVTSSTTGNITTLTNSTITIAITSTNTTIANTTISETTSTHVQSSFRIDRWDWSTWNTMSGLAIWITNTGTDPLDIFSLSVTIGGSPAGSFLYPGPAQACPLNPVSPQAQCLFMPTPSINPTKGNSYTIIITSSDGAQTSFSATYGGRSDDPAQFTVDDVTWMSTCCEYILSIHVTNTRGNILDTNQMAASVTFNGNSFTVPIACDSIASGMQCHITFRVGTLTSYIIVITDPRNGDQVYLITPG